ncbi:glycoside hydrolase family 32 protein [Mangrovibacillus cuniculi]|uniref:Sucrose-6-phosphate hydrolase n=1 Tax=Mangrovibacillus cuniculi TaxID=2593652 RepID=A0A7S8CCK9_9BACI|nr:sucrose-6-phosphate hydrolase [Mangrovibacillus cuniculi]QPC47499.1 sucrose-6-phosphate hydrolase [Mangrovibacillus cuniculi]
MNKHQKAIEKAAEFVETKRDNAQKSPWQLAYHITTPANWMNDPNGFSTFNGKYHLFYQFHPYSPEWGPMHWGHVTSKDLVHWEEQPIALAPSEAYDVDGCFSGSAIEKDGMLYLMYTGNVWTGPDHDKDLKQVQCIAVSEDGIHFEKYEGNPVISEVPAGLDIHPYHFRDPKVWQEGNTYYCVLGSRTNDQQGQVLLYQSADLLEWEFVSVLARGEDGFSFMWECPDLFELDGKDVLLFSPQGVKPRGDYFKNLHQAGTLVGDWDRTSHTFTHDDFTMMDYGFDYYAPQSTLSPDGRRITIAWMAMWESQMPEQEHDWAGAMTLPREVWLDAENQVRSYPVRELEALRGEMQTGDLKPYIGELQVEFDLKKTAIAEMLLRVGENGEKTILRYDAITEKLELNRYNSGVGPGGIRRCHVPLRDGKLTLNIFMDRSSIEVFANRGEKSMTARIYPAAESTGFDVKVSAESTISSVLYWPFHS